MLLDTTSNENFLNKDVDDGWALVEYLVQYDGHYNKDFDRTIRSSGDGELDPKEHVSELKRNRVQPVEQTNISVTEEYVTGDSEFQDGEDIQQVSAQNEAEDQAEKKIDSVLDQAHDRALDRVSDRVTDRVVPSEYDKPTKYIPSAYKPPLPFPGRFKEQMIRKLKEKIEKQELMAIQHEVTVEEKKEDIGSALEQYEPYPLYKGMLLNISKQKAKNQAKKDLDIGTAAIPTKLEDPGSFNLPCSLNYMHLNKCFCDLGASVSVMPFSIAEKLGYEEFKPSNLYISLADGSRKDVVGKLENFPVKIGKASIPTDFIIIEMEQELDDPIILGRPFLATPGAVIDVKKGMISLDIADGLNMRFDIKNTTNQPTIGGQPFVIEDKADVESFKIKLMLSLLR
ncbi:PREDICTED: uncharacterized protein LOC104773032 [Camelina sativa]|uniref:Uncharacterized protein LOC104773032 n=1 Tax=Camelina sativa TaxID=90675 RepID=A0ABM0Y5J4_CAMSA|nr:PREDICTED: uncharacterized protein LOC104773032 [Camelina sativa]